MSMAFLRGLVSDVTRAVDVALQWMWQAEESGRERDRRAAVVCGWVVLERIRLLGPTAPRDLCALRCYLVAAEIQCEPDEFRAIMHECGAALLKRITPSSRFIARVSPPQRAIDAIVVDFAGISQRSDAETAQRPPCCHSLSGTDGELNERGRKP